ncbi:hypothetical protein [Megasphaera cerevisiae]|jgi:hypothetical protein|uniref:hypothetical protein n=1 Tax=Megasphaera cerevisiae TaxID=39029 RepID=UPI0013563030|nr:hypothetical protein [Megasphaera cerevisiae]
MIHTTGAANVIISGDMGQITSPSPTDGLQNFAAHLLRDGGFSEQQVRLMLSENPQNLLQH